MQITRVLNKLDQGLDPNLLRRTFIVTIEALRSSLRIESKKTVHVIFSRYLPMTIQRKETETLTTFRNVFFKKYNFITGCYGLESCFEPV